MWATLAVALSFTAIADESYNFYGVFFCITHLLLVLLVLR